ncbi:MAG: phage holin family protein [Chitinophagaceae bacterium]|nr:phage holin family protein [Chitinophagaceae bacterium]
MEELKSKATDLTESISDYLNTYYKLKVITAAEKATTIGASAMAIFVVGFLGIFVLLFAGIAAAIWLGKLLDSWVLGYLAVAGIFLLIILILLALKRRIIFPMIRNSLINKLYEPQEQDTL